MSSAALQQLQLLPSFISAEHAQFVSLGKTGPFPQSACPCPCYFRMGTICVSPPFLILNIGNLCSLSSWSDLLEVIQSYRSFPRTSLWLSGCSLFLPSISPVSALFLSSCCSFSLHASIWRWLLGLLAAGLSIFPSWAFTAAESLWALRWQIDLISWPVLCSSHPILCILSISWDMQRKILAAVLTRVCWPMVWLDDGSAVLTRAC